LEEWLSWENKVFSTIERVAREYPYTGPESLQSDRRDSPDESDNGNDGNDKDRQHQ